MKPSRLPGWISGLGFVLLYLPLLWVVAFSFLVKDPITGTVSSTWHWYITAFTDSRILEALGNSFEVALASTGLAACVGTAGALAIERSRFPGRRILEALVQVSLVMPEIVLGLSLLVWFVLLRVALGRFSIILAHVSFSLPYVMITVSARLRGLDPSMEEAARDLGASAWGAFRAVTLPLIAPAVLSGALMAFTLSFDDFLVAFFTTGIGSDTLPLKIYSMIKFGVTPEINALSTLLLMATFILVLCIFKAQRQSHVK